MAYRDTILQGRPVQLFMDIYAPPETEKSGPVLIWFHAGGFNSGSIQAPGHRALARWLNGRGMTLIVPQYRINSERQDLSPQIEPRLKELNKHRLEGFRKGLSGVRSLAAFEDGIAALRWVKKNEKELCISGQIVMGGSSAGAIIALNIVHTAHFLGVDVPPVGGVISYSGGYPYPGLYHQAAVPVFAVHNPNDDRVDINSIRQLARRDAAVKLIEAPEQEHGSYFLSKGEHKRDAYNRIIERVAHFSGLS
ncbi:MAG: alpha/beta hydrolase [Pseudomonadota bacterium]